MPRRESIRLGNAGKYGAVAFVIFLIAMMFRSVTTPQTPVDVDVTPSTGLDQIPVQAGYGVRGGWFDLYFTDPYNPRSTDKRGGIDQPLAEAIQSARQSIDVAIYSINLWSIRDALIDAHRRGLTVRIVMESDNLDSAVAQALKEAGIPMLGDRKQGLMHNKFVVIDRSEVWTGSMNFTVTGAYSDHNNMVRIRSNKVAENYLKEFDEMFVDDRFGTDRVPETPNPVLTIDGSRVEVYFSPDDGVAKRLVELMNSARTSIHFLTFSFTNDDIAGAVLDRARAGVTVQGVFDTDQVRSNIGTEFDPFRQAGLDVRLDGTPGQMHHKVFVIDGEIVIAGSYNFSSNAERNNDENVVVLFNRDIAQQFLLEFERIFQYTSP